jgi:hypothetical protein
LGLIPRQLSRRIAADRQLFERSYREKRESTTVILEAQKLAKIFLNESVAPSNHIEIVVVECSPFLNATPAFVIEISHRDNPIRNAFGFTQTTSDGVRPFTIVPVEREAGRFRVLLPEQSSGQRLCPVLAFETTSKNDASSLGRDVVLRPLQ